MDSSLLLIVGICEINSKWLYLQICGAVLMERKVALYLLIFIFQVEYAGMINLSLFRPLIDIHFQNLTFRDQSRVNKTNA